MNKVSIIESDRNKFEIQFDTMLEMVAIFKKYDCKYNAKEKDGRSTKLITMQYSMNLNRLHALKIKNLMLKYL